MEKKQTASQETVSGTADESGKTQAGEPREPRFPIGGGSSEKPFLPETRPDWGTEWELHEDSFLF